MFMEYTHYNVDARLVKRYFEQSAETIEWLEDMGVEFEGALSLLPKIRSQHGISLKQIRESDLEPHHS